MIEEEGLALPLSGSGPGTERDLPRFRVNLLHPDKLQSPAKRVRSGGRAPIHAADGAELNGGNAHAASSRSSAASA